MLLKILIPPPWISMLLAATWQVKWSGRLFVITIIVEYKMNALKSIKIQLLFAFLSFTFISVVIAVASIVCFRKTEAIYKTTNSLIKYFPDIWRQSTSNRTILLLRLLIQIIFEQEKVNTRMNSMIWWKIFRKNLSLLSRTMFLKSLVVHIRRCSVGKVLFLAVHHRLYSQKPW